MKTILICALAAAIFAIDSPAAPEITPVPVNPAQARFRLIFKSYDAEPLKFAPSKRTFQIDTLDFRQPSQFLKLGDLIPNTPFRLMQFTYKEQLNPRTNDQDEVSELTVKNVKTGETVVLIYNKVIDTTAQPLK